MRSNWKAWGQCARRGLWIWLLLSAACTPRAGRHVATSPEGDIRWTVELVDGVPHGESRSFHPNGRLAILGHYQHGLQHGHFAYFDQDGNLVTTAVYVRGELVWRSSRPLEPAPPELVMTEPEPARPFLASIRPEALDHTFVTFGRVGFRPHARIKLASHRPAESAGGGDGRALELSGQGIWRGFGVYGTLFMSSLSRPEGDALRGKVVLDTGGVHARSLGRSHLIGSAGIALPLAHDDAAGFAAITATMTDQFNDAVIAYPGSVALRSSASLLGVDGRVYYRVETGLDAALSTGRGGELRMARRAELLARVSGGAGVALHWVTVGAELVNVVVLTGDPPTRTGHTGAVVGSLRGLPTQPFAAVSFPLLRGPSVRFPAVLVGVNHQLEAR